jgi:hypothetical protein
VIVHRATDVLAHPASYTTFFRHYKPLAVEIHGQGIRGAFRDTGMAPLSGRAEAMVDDGHPHVEILRCRDREQGFCRTGRNAGEIIA